MKIFNAVRRRPASLTLLATALLLGACNPIGKGVGPVSLTLTSPALVPGTTAARAYRCLPTLLTATLTFSDGSAGNFSNRVRWTSSNPAVVAVSNGDLAVPGMVNTFYPIGTVVASNTNSGSVVITAEFSGLSASLNMDTGVPTAFTVNMVNAQTSLNEIPAGNSFRMGPGTVQDLTVTAVIDNVEQNVESAANWVIETPNTAVATITPGTGVITAVASGGPLVARANFAACDVSASTNFSVANIQSISIQPEFETNGVPTNLFALNSERFNVLADFGDGPEQDISLFSTLTSSAVSTASFNTNVGSGNILTALAAGGPITIGATHAQSGATLTAPNVPLTVVDGTLQSIAITPATASVVTGSDQVQVFHATGTFVGGQVQDVSRRAVWTSSATATASVSTGLSAPGQAVAVGRTPGTSTISAAISTTPAVTAATAQLTTTAPAPVAP
jgi:hypothetical protein